MGGSGSAATGGAVDDFLAHYGVKGMRWGIRRKPKAPPSEDVQRVKATESKIRRGKTDALSNKELQDVVTRMNLEQQYSRMVSEQQKRKYEANKFIAETLIAIGKNPAVRAGASAAAKKVAAVLLSR
jgi:hypothetical protein